MADVIDHSLDGESRFTEIIAILSAGAILTTAVVSLRIFTRTVLLRTIGVDDAFIIAAQILAIGTAVAIGREVGKTTLPIGMSHVLTGRRVQRFDGGSGGTLGSSPRRTTYPI